MICNPSVNRLVRTAVCCWKGKSTPRAPSSGYALPEFRIVNRDRVAADCEAVHEFGGDSLPEFRIVNRDRVAAEFMHSFTIGVFISAIPCRTDHSSGHRSISEVHATASSWPALLPTPANCSARCSESTQFKLHGMCGTAFTPR